MLQKKEVRKLFAVVLHVRAFRCLAKGCWTIQEISCINLLSEWSKPFSRKHLLWKMFRG